MLNNEAHVATHDMVCWWHCWWLMSVSSLGNVVRPVLVISPKLSSIGPDQYLDGRPPGDLVGVLYDIWGFSKPLGLGAVVGQITSSG